MVLPFETLRDSKTISTSHCFTESYDNLHAHSQQIGNATFAREMLLNTLLHRTLLAYIVDASNSGLDEKLRGRSIAGQFIELHVAAAFEDAHAFTARTVVPLIRMIAGGTIEAGQMVTAPPEALIRNALVSTHLGQHDLALKAYDEAFQSDLSTQARIAALNYKGLVLVAMGNKAEAILAFKAALEIDSTKEEPRANLARLFGADSS